MGWHVVCGGVLGLAVLTGCATTGTPVSDRGAVADPGSAAVQAAPSSVVGQCRDYGYRAGKLATNDSRVVDCRESHTAQTITVQVLPDTAVGEVARYWERDADAGADSSSDGFPPAAGGVIEGLVEACSAARDSVLGWSEPMLPHRYTLYWFLPSRERWQAGDRAARCDLALQVAKVTDDRVVNRNADLPAADMTGYLGAVQAIGWVRCQRPTGAWHPDSDCSGDRDQVVVAARQLPLGPYPGARKLKTKAQQWCRTRLADHAHHRQQWRGTARYPNTKKSWDGGNRTITCLMPVTDWDGAGR